MEVKIGIQHASRELTFDSNDSAEDLEQQVADAMQNSGTLALSDARGRRIVVPGEKIAYVEIGSSTVGTVGFRS